MNRFRFALALALSLALPSAAQAAITAKPAPLKVMPATPVAISDLTGAAGDQVSALALTPSAIVLAGTVESASATSAWVSSNSLGGTDGFIAALDSSGKRIWDIRLGSAQDEIATAMVSDKQGNFWVVGAQQGVATPIPAPTPSAPSSIPTVNPDSVKVQPVRPPASPLSRLMIWEINSVGQLVNTYTYDSNGAIFPQQVSVQGAGLLISGRTIVGSNVQSFTTTFDGTKIATLTLFSQRVMPVAFNRAFTIPSGTIKSYIALGPIAAIPTWKSKAAVPVVIQYSKKKAVVAASYLHGSIVDMQYQRNLGVIAIASQAGGYALYQIAIKA